MAGKKMASRPDFYLVKNGFKIAIWSILKSPYLIIWLILENFLVDWHFFILQRCLQLSDEQPANQTL
jgi:hypothetical protein